MSLAKLLWPISLFWIVVHIAAGLVKRKRYPILPIANVTSESKVQVDLKYFFLKIRSTFYNSSHDDLINYIRNASSLQTFLVVFYNIGTFAAILGSLVGIIGLICSSASVLHNLLHFPFPKGTTSYDKINKRDSSGISAATLNGRAFLNPIIPGVTTPLFHLPYLLGALFASQVIHEVGHALSAASDNISLESVGVSVSLIIPSAFTELSSDLSSLPILGKLRVISAGTWHNLVFYGFLALLSLLSSTLWTTFGWDDISSQGLVVLSVASDSPLVYYLQPGSLITGLDDISITTSSTPEEVWSSYLLSSPSPSFGYEKGGWCIADDLFSHQPQACCPPITQPSHPPGAALSCFVPQTFDSDLVSGVTPDGRCIDPVQLLSTQSAQRCLSVDGCEGGVCIRPHESAELLRITVEPPSKFSERNESDSDVHTETILWSGPRREIWEQVQVGKYRPRYSFLPLWLPSCVSLFFSYLSMMNLTLYFLNLFFLPFLDGGQLLAILTDFVLERYSRGHNSDFAIDLESMGTRSRSRTPSPALRGRRFNSHASKLVEKGLTTITIVLSCVVVLGMLLKEGLRQSYT